MKSNEKKFVVFVGAQVLNLMLVVVLMLIDEMAAAAFFSIAGVWTIMLVTLAYVTIWDSRRRWPDEPWHERFLNVMTFKR